MARNRFRKNEAGIGQMLTCDALRALLLDVGDSAKAAAEGQSETRRPTYTVKAGVYNGRVSVLVGTGDEDSRRDNAEHNSLERARRGIRL